MFVNVDFEDQSAAAASSLEVSRSQAMAGKARHPATSVVRPATSAPERDTSSASYLKRIIGGARDKVAAALGRDEQAIRHSIRGLAGRRRNGSRHRLATLDNAVGEGGATRSGRRGRSTCGWEETLGADRVPGHDDLDPGGSTVERFGAIGCGTGPRGRRHRRACAGSGRQRRRRQSGSGTYPPRWRVVRRLARGCKAQDKEDEKE